MTERCCRTCRYFESVKPYPYAAEPWDTGQCLDPDKLIYDDRYKAPAEDGDGRFYPFTREGFVCSQHSPRPAKGRTLMTNSGEKRSMESWASQLRDGAGAPIKIGTDVKDVLIYDHRHCNSCRCIVSVGTWRKQRGYCSACLPREDADDQAR